MDDDQLAYALMFDGVRLSYGSKWLVHDVSQEYVVYTHSPYARKSKEVYRGESLKLAVDALLKED